MWAKLLSKILSEAEGLSLLLRHDPRIKTAFPNLTMSYSYRSASIGSMRAARHAG